MQLEAVQANELAGLVLAESLVQLGVEHVILSPGSRCTPLTYACALDDRLQCSVVLDERSAGFFALGKAKASGMPAVLICTSGTAAANYLPAVVEARYSHTPLLVITPDRPLMGQHCHSGQTILQPGLFDNFCNHAQQLELPRSEVAFVRYLRETLREAVWRSQYPQPGVVHLNVPLEEPLSPKLDPTTYPALRNELIDRFFPGQPVPVPSHSDVRLAHSTLSFRSCLWILGSGHRCEDASAYSGLLECLAEMQIPVLVDGLHPARSLMDSGAAGILTYEWLLQSAHALRTSLQPDLIFQWGNLPTSKSLRATLSQWDCQRIVVQDHSESDHRDPSFTRTLQRLHPDAALDACSRILQRSSSQQGLFDRWQEADRKAVEQLQRLCGREAPWTEAMVCRSLPQFLSHPCDLFIANSMIIRDVENFYPGAAKVQRVLSNRGANGIDGLISTALGATRDQIPMVCLIGDLSFLHDAGGLNLIRQQQPGQKTLFILLDNQGGGIFEHLAIASHSQVFEPFFATPQTVNFDALCAAYGVRYHKVDGLGALGESLNVLLSQPSDTAQVHCLHLAFDRKQSCHFRKSVAAALQLG